MVRLNRKLRRVFGRHARAIAEHYAAGRRDPDDLLPPTELQADLRPLLLEARVRRFIAVYAATAAMVEAARQKSDAGDLAAGVSADWALQHPELIAYIERTVGENLDLITATTREQLRAALVQVAEEGLPLAQAVKRIEEIWTDISRTRAKRIARKEVIGATNAANVQAMADAGLHHHEWASSGRTNVRPSHRIDGEIVPVGEPFSNGVVTPAEDGPVGEIMNCYCVTIPVEQELRGEPVPDQNDRPVDYSLPVLPGS